MANQLLTSDIILNRAMAVLFQAPVFLNKVNTQYDNQFFGKGVPLKTGATGRVRIPSRAVIRDGRVMQIQDQIDLYKPVTIDKYKGVDTGATSLERALDINDYQEQFIDTKIPDLVAAVEADGLATCLPQVFHAAGDYGVFNDALTVLEAGKVLNDNLAPNDRRYLLTNTLGEVQMVNALTGFYNPQSKISDQFETGMMQKNTLGFDWYRSTLMPSLTRGSANASYETAPTTNWTEGGSTIDIDTGTGTWAVGDIFTIEGVNEVHPQTKQDMGYLKQFVCTTANGGGSVTLAFSPAIYSTGPQQNVSAAPAANKDVLPLGTASATYMQNLAWHPDAFYFVTADLPQPVGMGVDVAQKTVNGVTMRFMQGFDITQDMYVSRFDIAYGFGVLRPELACRIPNSVS